MKPKTHYVIMSHGWFFMKNVYLDWAVLQDFLDGKLENLRSYLLSNRLVISVSHICDLTLMTHLENAKARLKALDHYSGTKIFLPFPEEINIWNNSLILH